METTQTIQKFTCSLKSEIKLAVRISNLNTLQDTFQIAQKEDKN